MRAIQLSLAGFLLLLTGLWLLADPLPAAPIGFLALRSAMVVGTGIVAIGAMSASLVLATRPVWLEPWLGGLDKMYRLHKWLGIAALAAAVLHWLWTQAPKWLVALGWIERQTRPHVQGQSQADTLQGFMQSQRGLAEVVGEWAFYACVVLIVLALVKRFPYHLFFKTHKLLAVAYLALVLHSVVLMKPDDWLSPLGLVLGLLLAAGSIAAVVALAGRIGQTRRAVGEVQGLRYQPELQVLALDIQLKSRWGGHEAGQFAFMGFGDRERPHPFTLTSAWADDGKLQVLIKELGDYTRTLHGRLHCGSLVEVEGPYGRFNFNGSASRQIWVGGGIGITPFIARMKALALHADGREIDLFHSTSLIDPASLQRLRGDAHAAHIRLHVLVDSQDGLLSAQRICDAVPQWAGADLWFCGPARFGQALRQQFVARGLPAGRFHQELFDLR